jgi:hypothetical protein
MAETVNKYKLKGVALCRRCNGEITPSHLSRFLKGTADMALNKFETLVNAMPPEAQQHYYTLAHGEARSANTEDAIISETDLENILRRYVNDGYSFNEVLRIANGINKERLGSTNRKNLTTTEVLG